MDASVDLGARRESALARGLERLFREIARRLVAPDGGLTGVPSSVVLAAAAVPFAGWLAPSIWLSAIVALSVGEGVWRRRARARLAAAPAPAGRSEPLNPFTWLISAGFSVAAMYLVVFFTGAAQTLGVTLYGVVMFQILARDYAQPRRLAANLSAPILSMVFVQTFAAILIFQRGVPWQMVTLLASPLIVFRAFRAVQYNLTNSHRLEREALAQLGDSEARYRLLAERSPDIILRYDLAGRVEYVSPATRLYGYEPSQVVGRNVTEFLAPGDKARSDAFMATLAAGAPLPQGEENVWRSWAADGRMVAFEGATSILVDDQGRRIGAMAVLRDITARQALEAELRDKRAEAEAAAVAKSQFLANMSHEIRTPLTGVIGFAGLLEAIPDLPDQARRYAGRIHKSADALLLVVNDVLDFSKLEAGQVEIERRPMDPRAVVEETVDLIRDQAAAKGLALRVEAGPELPAALLGDCARLRQVLLNLLTNAVKFTATGQITVTAGYDGGRLRVAVRDTGVGIPAELAGRLFQRFSQIDGSNSRQHGGSGLGLAICKGLVERMGGEIGVDSQTGVGSTFWFTVDAPEGEAEAEAPVAAAQSPVGAAGVSSPASEGALRLLVVDDVAVNRELVSIMLAPFDVRIVEAASGPAALDAASAAPFDLILMDLQMPGMDGMAAAAAIRAAPGPNRATPIVALTANVLPSQVEACRKAGMDDHIGKPIAPEELLGKIARWTTRAAA
ncbi:MAG: response regulator [Proteobacteria bacterium]|nr:response regulator [Pseudomonadota bacterium]